jgi:signal transduction histidine kinase
MKAPSKALPAAAAQRTEQVDARMLGLMRCVLAFSALAIIWIDPSEPQRLVALTYASLAAYCLYSTFIAFIAWRAGWPAPGRFAHWADVFFYTFLIALTEGTNSIFFHFYVFAVLVAAHSRGFREGMAVTCVSVLLFTVVGIVTAPSGSEFELNRALIRPVYLFALGYMIAFWGGYEMLLKRRLRLLQEVNNLWNPRLGVDPAIGANLERLLNFYDADASDTCLLVLRRPGAPARFLLYTAARRQPGQAALPNEITESTAEALLRLPESVGAAWRDPAQSRWPWRRVYVAHDIELHAPAADLRDECAALANLLDTRSYVTVPYSQRDGVTGRIYLTSEARSFGQTDIDFLAQAAEAIAVVVENMSLMEELISRAAEHERLKISRDLHDTTIQPYIGIKLALEALQRDAGADSPMAQRIAELVDMAGMTIRDLRSYTASLKEQTPMPGEFLVAAVKKQAERLGRFYGIAVEVQSDISAHLNGRVAAEVFQIISEGLSNILRHTTAKAAQVQILCEGSILMLKIGNAAGEGAETPAAAASFTPRSIQERVQALGGTTYVERGADGYTTVHLMVPI